jgi:RNA polymerase sigma-70 factor (ECF subfamily)
VDHDAFCAFYNATSRGLKKYLLSILHDADRADDVLQESYLRMLKIRNKMDERHRKNYLYTVARRLALSERASAMREAGTFDWTLLETACADEVAARDEVRQLLKQVTDRQRELLWLAYVEQFSHAEIAEIIGVKNESVRPMLARARCEFAAVLRVHGITGREKYKVNA